MSKCSGQGVVDQDKELLSKCSGQGVADLHHTYQGVALNRKYQPADQETTSRPSDNFQTKGPLSREVKTFTRGDTGHEEQEAQAGPATGVHRKVLPVTAGVPRSKETAPPPRTTLEP